MNDYRSSAELKAIAKEKSLGRYGTLIGANILIFAIQLFISGFGGVSVSSGILLIIIGNIISLIINILVGILVSGKAYLYMNLLYSQNISLSDVFFGFRQNPQKAVIIQAVFALVDFLVTIPGQITLILYTMSPDPKLLICSMFALGIGLIVEVLVYLTYSQSFFLLHDFPDKSAKELLSLSRRLMKGNKFRLFYLNVTFLPLYIFGVITLFIPLIWVSVYRYATTCAFYQDLVEKAATHKGW
ncbi:MAG: DUF975 family protein [Butyrivibrio sp.]|nr:DUF975 family protein [Butyrivibrio sp.]